MHQARTSLVTVVREVRVYSHEVSDPMLRCYLLEKLVWVLGELKEHFFCAQLPCYLLEKLVWVLDEMKEQFFFVLNYLATFWKNWCMFWVR